MADTQSAPAAPAAAKKAAKAPAAPAAAERTQPVSTRRPPARGRLYAKAVFTGYKRGLRNQHEGQAILKVSNMCRRIVRVCINCLVPETVCSSEAKKCEEKSDYSDEKMREVDFFLSLHLFAERLYSCPT